MTRPFTAATIALLLAIAVAQAGRAILGIDVSIAGAPVLPVVSWVIAALAAALAGGLIWEWSWAQPVPVDTDGPPATKLSSTGPDAEYESVKIDGRFVPAAYFMFASSPPLTSTAIRQAKQRHGRILVGFDAGAIPDAGEITNSSYKAAVEAGAELEIYVEGPGGPTGAAWLPDEKERVKAAAALVGVDTKAKDWLERGWNGGGWKAYTFRQLENYKRRGFNAAEIDNLYRVIETSEGLIAFYKEYGKLCSADRLPQLIMKNIDEPTLRSVVKAIQSNELPRTMFSEFHIFEISSGDPWHMLDKISSEVGIRTVVSTNTRKYAAAGTYGLNREFDVATGQQDAPVAAAKPA